MSQDPYQPPRHPNPPQAPENVPPPPRVRTNALAIIAGILLILAAQVNLFGAAVCFVGGTFASDLGSVSDVPEVDASGNPQPQREIKPLVELGTFFYVLGIVLLLLVALTVTAAIMLFLAKAPTFVLVAAGLQIMADLISYWALEIIGWLNLTGLIAGALAMAAALSIKKKIQAIPAR